MLEELRRLCRDYKSSGVKEKTAFPYQAGVLELAFTMGTVRAVYRPERPPHADESAWKQAAEPFLNAHGLLHDYRDDSYVFSTQEGTYLGRMRFDELMFTPERFEDKEELLQGLQAFYSSRT